MKKQTITTIVLFFFIVVFFFGDRLMFWYEHKDDMQLNLSRLVYTKADFEKMEEADKTALLDEISRICIRKHHVDKLNCSDTAYWLAHSLEDKGIDVDLAIEWMTPCTDACENGKYDPSVFVERNKVTGAKMDKSKKETEGTKWIWEED